MNETDIYPNCGSENFNKISQEFVEPDELLVSQIMKAWQEHEKGVIGDWFLKLEPQLRWKIDYFIQTNKLA